MVGQRGMTMLATAFTGIAVSLLIDGERTMHSRFRIPIPNNIGMNSNMQVHTEEAQQLKDCRLH